MANSQQFYNRLNQLAGTSKKINESTGINNATLIDFEKANDGTVLGVIKENHNYHVKVSKKSGNDFSVADFTYIGGLSNKTDNAHATLSEAQKQRNYKLKSLNEAFSLTGKAHLIQESTKTEKTPLEIKEDVGSFLSNRIKEGKKNISESREVNFKSSLSKEKETIKKKTSLMNEAALTAIQRALGKTPINEDMGESLIVKDSELDAGDSIANDTNPAPKKSGESLITKDGEIDAGDSVANDTNPPPKKAGTDLSTADSEQSESDVVANKKGKEPAQAPINDTNAKDIASKNGGAMTEGNDLSTRDSYQDTGNSIANKTNPPPSKSGKDLSTEDSELDADDSIANKTNPAPKKSGESLITKDGEIVASDSLANKSDKKEDSQAPINDKNAKTEAGKNGGAMNEAEDLSTKDSDQEESDVIANEDGHESPDSYDTHYHPEKGHKEKKGEELKPIKQKGAIVAEADDLSTADSDQDTENSVANKTNPAPKKSGESLITKDGEVDATKSVANEANKPNKKSGKDLSTADSEQDTDNSIANKVNVRESVEGALAAAKDKEEELDAVEDKADTEVDVVDPIAGGGEEDIDPMGGEEDIDPIAGGEDTSDIDIDNMDLDVDAEGGEEGGELDADLSVDGEEGGLDAEIDAEVDPAAGGDDSDPMVKELEKLVGKTGQAAQQVDLSPEKTDELFSAVIGSFEKNLSKAGPEKGIEWTDKIEKATAGEGVRDEVDVDVDAEVEADPMGGEEMEADAAIDQQIDDLGGVQEDTPPLVDGEPLGDEVAAELGIEDDEMDVDDPNDVIPDMAESSCNECGTFESYCAGQGADMAGLSGMEVADMISGYADAHKEGQNDGDFEGVAVYLADPEIKQGVSDYGHEDYVAQAEPFIKNVDETEAKKMYAGVYEPTLGEVDDEIEGDDVVSDVVGDVDDAAADDAIGDVASDVADTEDIGGEEDAAVVEPVGGPVEEPPLDLTNLPQQPEPTFGLGAQVMDAGVMKPESPINKTVDVDLQTGKVIVSMNEEEEKLRKIIRLKLDEKFGKRKPSLNESEKSKSSKVIDKMIAEQLNLYEKVIGKKIGK